MTLAGVIVTFAGFLISVASLGMVSDVSARMIVVLVGILVSLVGIIGMINRAAVSKAIWRK